MKATLRNSSQSLLFLICSQWITSFHKVLAIMMKAGVSYFAWLVPLFLWLEKEKTKRLRNTAASCPNYDIGRMRQGLIYFVGRESKNHKIFMFTPAFHRRWYLKILSYLIQFASGLLVFSAAATTNKKQKLDSLQDTWDLWHFSSCFKATSHPS